MANVCIQHDNRLNNDDQFIQYTLWYNCSNRCDFCHFNGITTNVDKKQTIKFAKNFISKIRNCSIGLIGGELFDRNMDDVEFEFFQLVKTCIEGIKANKLVNIYLSTSLLFDVDLHLINILEEFRKTNTIGNVVLCTSYDTIGRFHTDISRQLWSRNVKRVKQLFPTIRIHTEIILTEDFMQKVLANEFNILDFKIENNTSIDFMSPHMIDWNNRNCNKSSIENFFPKRTTFIKFVKKTIIVDKIIPKERFLNWQLRASTIYYPYNGKIVKYTNRRSIHNNFDDIQKMMNFTQTTGYIDSNSTLENDLQMII